MFDSSTVRVRRARRAGAATLLAAGLAVGTVGVTIPSGPVAAASVTAADVVGLTKGAHGEQVRAVQVALNRVGVGVKYGVDGYFGSATLASVKAFQRYKGLPITGVVDAATAAALGFAAPAPRVAAPAATRSAAGTLALGARGAKVQQLQQALTAAGLPPAGGVDGIFGVGTRQAVVTFQQRAGLPATGGVDAATSAALTAAATPAAQAPVAAAAPAAVATAIVGLQLGATGPLVAQLQQAIMKMGWPLARGADGTFGASTKAALAAVQRANGLAPTGVVDERTARLLGLAAPPPAVAAANGAAPAASTAAGFPLYDEHGARVVALQLALAAAGVVLRGGADGVFGSSTLNGVLTVQRSRGLPATGKVDAATAAALGLAPMDPPVAAAPVAITLEAKPVQGPCYTGDTWARGALGRPGPHRHGHHRQGGQRALRRHERDDLEDLHRREGPADGERAAHRPTRRHLLLLRPPLGAGAGDRRRCGCLGRPGRRLRRAHRQRRRATPPHRGPPRRRVRRQPLPDRQSHRRVLRLRSSMSPRIPSRRTRLRRRTAAAVLSAGLAFGAGAVALPGAPASAAPAAPAASVIGLQKGMSGENVKALQNALNRVGVGVKYGVDGYFGSATQASVKALQRFKGLAITGIVDAATAKALGFATSAPAARAKAPAPTVAKAAPAAGNATSIAGLQGGASGPAVVQLQQAITRAGWPLAADGVFGTRTKAALTAIQKANGIPATGAVDDRTARLLGLTGGAVATPITAALTAATPAPAAAAAVAAPTGPPPPVSPGAATAVAAATSQLGVPYVAFALAPGVAFDCSGLTAWAWAQAGVSLPHQSGMQFAGLPHVAVADAQPGDLLFYHSPIRHVTIYIGNGRMIHAPNPGSVVQVGTVNWNNVVGIARPG